MYGDPEQILNQMLCYLCLP